MILIRQSELNAAGYSGNFPTADMRTQRNWAAIVCRKRGDDSQAFMLEMNNVLAIGKITYVNDTY